jgi:transcription initiation factor IIF auxiliary subunit
MTVKRILALLMILDVMLLVPAIGVAQAASLDIQNVAEQIGKERWKWTAFVSGSPDEIEKIDCVEYTLHPTFPNPVETICKTDDPKHPFALVATGWGVFNLRARIKFKDGSSLELTHFLKF